MFTDEEQLIYEDDDDDDDVAGWDNVSPVPSESNTISSTTSSERFEKVSIGDTLDNDYFLDRTLTSISTPENRIWNLGTTSGYVNA